MLIGDRTVFAIECHHDPIQNPSRNVYGRMCMWFGAFRLGDPEEQTCMLDVTEVALRDILHQLDSLDDGALVGLSPADAFAFLDNALYLDIGQSDQQIESDAARLSKFDLLTNGGESFDHTKSFVVTQGDIVRVLFRDEAGLFHSADVSRSGFIDVLQRFLGWLANEREGAG